MQTIQDWRTKEIKVFKETKDFKKDLLEEIKADQLGFCFQWGGDAEALLDDIYRNYAMYHGDHLTIGRLVSLRLEKEMDKLAEQRWEADEEARKYD